jgi:uncharacterized cofD-like protein
MGTLKIAALGGGSGLSTLLRGLKKYDVEITAVVNVADDGGSSGRLRNEMGVLPPGDIRNCLTALSEEESLMSRLFQYRFPAKGSLAGHSFGNLFLTAMSAISGGFDAAIANCGEVLAIRGRVLPVTLSSVTLNAELENGKIAYGESAVSKAEEKIKRVFLTPFAPAAAPEVLNALKNADIIIFGPGSLYTSIIVNLLVDGVAEAVKSSKAYIEKQKEFKPFFDLFSALISKTLPGYIKEGKSHLTIAIGCTGGRHRSVYSAERLANFLKNKKYVVQINHRDILRGR